MTRYEPKHQDESYYQLLCQALRSPVREANAELQVSHGWEQWRRQLFKYQKERQVEKEQAGQTCEKQSLWQTPGWQWPEYSGCLIEWAALRYLYLSGLPLVDSFILFNQKWKVLVHIFFVSGRNDM